MHIPIPVQFIHPASYCRATLRSYVPSWSGNAALSRMIARCNENRVLKLGLRDFIFRNKTMHMQLEARFKASSYLSF
jgi:hypothetical protein